jgi:trimethylamine--corrinoid protein Co-methyltransferase
MGQRLNPIVPRLRWNVLRPDDIEAIHESILWTLEEVGVSFPNERALDVLAGNGCAVDRATSVARMPRTIVMEALAQAPRSFTLAARDPEADVVLDGKHCYLTSDGCGVFVIDPRTGEKRASTKADVADSARFVDALPNIAFYWGPMVTAEDVPAVARRMHEVEAIYSNTTKHFQTVDCVTGETARAAIEMAAVVAGGKDELRRRPLLSFVQCPIDPLGNDGEALEAGLVAAEYGVPSCFLSLTLGCATGPATMAGNLVVNMAAVIADTALMQLAFPGAPVFLSGAPSIMDLKTGGYTGGGPEDGLMSAAAVELAHFYGLPAAMGAMGSGAKAENWQAAVDDTFSTILPLMAHADMLNGCGLLDGSKTLSYPLAVMESEIYGFAQQIAGGIEVTPETLAREAIKAVGQGGTYLGQKHTRAHMKEIWQPAVFDRSPYEMWVRGGKAGAFERAREIAVDILENHKPEPLLAEVAAELRAMVERAEAG